MNIKGRPISHLPGRAMVSLTALAERVKVSLRNRFPEALGLPVTGPVVQLYRHDNRFTTELSVFNYLSVFLPDIEQKIRYQVVAYDRNGRKIGEGQVALKHDAMTQLNLQKIVGGNLDAYGMFHVSARPESVDRKASAMIRETSGQFMTLFYQRNRSAQAPQIIHSHKPFQTLPIFRSPITREPSITESVSSLQSLDLFFLNPNPLRLQVEVAVKDGSTGIVLLRRTLGVKGFGVSVISYDHETMLNWSDYVSFEYQFDRQVSHTKPILFRYFPEGLATCNHT